MKKRAKRRSKLVREVAESANKKPKPVDSFSPPKGNTNKITSTGSTLLDLEISGLETRGGGLPSGILVEIAGPNSCGKTSLLCEIAGNVKRKKGEVFFFDPEARLNKRYASLFDLNPDETEYSRPDTIPEVFGPVRSWKPKNKDVVNGIFGDSLAALSTELEMTKVGGDKMGMRRGKEFSQEMRRTCRIITNNDYLMVCSNQLRATGNMFGPGEDSTGGNAIRYYSSLRIRYRKIERLTRDIKFGPKERKVEEDYGIKATLEIIKSSISIPHGKADIYFIYNYGIDDVRANLQYTKHMIGTNNYVIYGGTDGCYPLGASMNKAINKIESENLVDRLREGVINIWLEIKNKLRETKYKRAPKRRL